VMWRDRSQLGSAACSRLAVGPLRSRDPRRRNDAHRHGQSLGPFTQGVAILADVLSRELPLPLDLQALRRQTVATSRSSVRIQLVAVT
jgi:hypothetical protein